MHTRLTTLLCVAVLATVFAALQYLAFKYYFYWIYWWYDVLMHGIGGLVVGAAACWWLTHEARLTPRLGTVLGITLLIGILWEVFEYVIGAPREAAYVFDTLSDIGMDLVGGLIAWRIFR